MDGANHFRTLFRIFLPISMPSIATIALFSMVFHWNSWFDGLLYMNNAKDYPLATFMQTVIIGRDMSSMSMNPKEMEALSQTTVRAGSDLHRKCTDLDCVSFPATFLCQRYDVGLS